MEAGSRAFGYARVSSAEQGISGLGLDAQTATIDAYAGQRGWILTGIRTEVASGAKRKPRPVLAGVLEQLGKGDVLVVAKADRLARSLSGYVELIDQAHRGGWSVVAADGSIDLSTPHGRAMSAMAAVFGELEAELIGDRTSQALQAAKARGTQLGRRPAKIPTRVQRKAARWRSDGATLQAIADRLNEAGDAAPSGGRWHPQSVARILT